jgi:hypothetical protein
VGKSPRHKDTRWKRDTTMSAATEKRTGRNGKLAKAKAEARLAYHDALLSTEQLAALLCVDRAWVRRLTLSGVLTKTENGRFRLIDAVQAYLRYVRDENRRTGKAEMTNAVLRARAHEIELRTAQRERSLIEIDDVLGTLDEMVGMFLTGLSELPAACGGRDLTARRTIEAATRDLRQRIADKAKAKMRELAA